MNDATRPTATLLTIEISSMLLNCSLPKEKRFDILMNVLYDCPLTGVMECALAETLKIGVDSFRKKAEIKKKYNKAQYLQKAKKRQTRKPVPDNSNSSENSEFSESENVTMDSSENSEFSATKPSQAKPSQDKSYNPLNPPGGIAGASSSDDRQADGTDEPVADANLVAERIEATEAFGHMRVNPGKLRKACASLLKKDGAAGEAIMAGLAAWTPIWRKDDWRWAPRRISDWLYDEKFRESPPEPKPEPKPEWHPETPLDSEDWV